MHALIFLSILFTLVLAERPVVLWHGMGDDCCNEDSMGRITNLIKKHLGQDTFVYSVKIGDDIDDDHKAGFFGQLEQQLDRVSKDLVSIPELKNGFNSVGFSQGGLFLRAYAQKYNQPSVHRLITFGSPHGGVSDIPNCTNPRDFTCRLMKTMVRHGVYTDYIQNRVIQAQYYRDPFNLKAYREKNKFLPFFNNEIQHGQSKTYKNNLLSLDKFVAIKFSDDTMIKPAETAWFSVEDENSKPIPLRDQELYNDDWLGLKKLNETGRLEFLVCSGQHMQISDDYFEQITVEYLIEKPQMVYQEV